MGKAGTQVQNIFPTLSKCNVSYLPLVEFSSPGTTDFRAPMGQIAPSSAPLERTFMYRIP